MSKARGLADLGNVYSDGALSNRNLIINGAMQVSQRGNYTTSTSFINGRYYLDRWVGISGATATLQELSVSQPNAVGKSVRVTTSSGGTLQCTLEQRIESPQWLTSRTVTLSAWVKSNSSFCALNIYHGVDGFATSVSHSGGGAWEKLKLIYTFSGSSTSDLRTRIGLSQGGNTTVVAGDYFEITEVQLEAGDTATPFEHRSYGQELALCQRYYETGRYYVQATSVSGSLGTTATFKLTKRAAPTVTFANLTGVINGIASTGLDSVRSYGSVGASSQVQYDWTADAEL